MAKDSPVLISPDRPDSDCSDAEGLGAEGLRTDRLHPVAFGPLSVRNNLWLAPIAGGSELAFRTICMEMGAGLVCTELVSARGIRCAHSLEPSYRYLAVTPVPEPTAIQLFGAEADDFRAALDLLLSDERCRGVRVIDINMGCPVAKVVKSGSGAALLRDWPRAAAIVRAVKAIVEPLNIACTVKTRIGFAAGEDCAADFVRLLAASGADLISLHGRTRAQMYGGKADWAAIGRARAALEEAGGSKIPLIANGDVVDGPSAAALLRASGAAGVMIGRAALGNPWIFSAIAAYLTDGRSVEAPGGEERARIGRRHAALLIAELGEEVACRELRKTLGWYTRGLEHAAQLRRLAGQVSSAANIDAFWDTVAARADG